MSAADAATKDFDVERLANANGNGKPITFTVGGKKFTVREFVSAEVMGNFGRRQVANFGDTLEAYDAFIKGCILEKEGAAWDKVRVEADPPISVGAIEQILWWLMDVASGRPTEASSSSRRGRVAQTAT